MKLQTGKREIALYLLPSIALLTVIQVFPFAYTAILSFHNWYLPMQQSPVFSGLANYARAITDPRFLNSLKVLGQFSLGTLALEFTFGLAVALLLNRELHGRNLFRSLFILPMMATPAAMTLVWKVMLNPTTGVVNQLLDPVYRLLNVEPLAWAGSSSTAMLSVILVSFWRWAPFVMLILLAGLQSIPRSLYEAADVDGAGPWQKFLFITLPRLRGPLVIAFLFRSMDMLKTFDEVYILTGGGPAQTTELTNIYVFFQGFEAYQMGYSSALVMFLFAFATLFACGSLWLLGKD
ncbi:MAG: carbohydrate ABC transporter permease [Bacteroidota bacterium]